MVDGAGQRVGDGLDAAVRMPGEAGEIVLRPVVAEIVEQQERIGLARFAEAEGEGPDLAVAEGEGGWRAACE